MGPTVGQAWGALRAAPVLRPGFACPRWWSGTPVQRFFFGPLAVILLDFRWFHVSKP